MHLLIEKVENINVSLKQRDFLSAFCANAKISAQILDNNDIV